MDIPRHHEVALLTFFAEGEEAAHVRFFQERYGGLVVDGIYGKNTAAAIDEYLGGKKPEGGVKSQMRAAFDGCMTEVGKREEPLGSNTSEDIEAWREEVDLPQRGNGEWCGLLQSVHLMRNGIPVKSRGAQGIVRGIIALPRGREVEIEDIRAGFVGMSSHHRGSEGSGKHHVRIFRCFMTGAGLRIEHVGGNENHRVKTKIWKMADYFEGERVKQVATYE